MKIHEHLSQSMTIHKNIWKPWQSINIYENLCKSWKYIKIYENQWNTNTKMYEHVGNHKQKYKSKQNNKNQYNYIKINKYKKKTYTVMKHMQIYINP